MFKQILLVVAVALVMVMVTTGKTAKDSKLKEKRVKAAEKYLKEKKQMVIRAECQPTEFSCSFGYCISLDQVCDTHHNCPGGDDEQNCPHNCTGPHQFKCANSDKCIGLVDKCDGIKDCSDYSDEAFCESFECPAGRFKCQTSNECIHQDLVCDDSRDCEDGSDERNCVNGSCSTDQIKCSDGSRCIPSDYICDTYDDCADRSDEKGCSCETTDFKCTNEKCVPSSYKCDGYNDCGDLSDELGCPAEPPSVCHNVMSYSDCRQVNETTHPICLIHADADKFCREFCGLC